VAVNLLQRIVRVNQKYEYESDLAQALLLGSNLCPPGFRKISTE